MTDSVISTNRLAFSSQFSEPLPHIRRSEEWSGCDHWSSDYGALWAGAGIRPCQIIGTIDRSAAEVKDHPVRRSDLAATNYSALGTAKGLMLPSVTGRPHRISDGIAMRQLFD
jgi:hypothetical protein